MKMIVETTGPFQLVDFQVGQMVQAERPSVVTKSGFIQARISAGQVNVLLDKVVEDLTDEKWVTILKDAKDLDAALDKVKVKVTVKAPAAGNTDGK